MFMHVICFNVVYPLTFNDDTHVQDCVEWVTTTYFGKFDVISEVDEYLQLIYYLYPM